MQINHYHQLRRELTYLEGVLSDIERFRQHRKGTIDPLSDATRASLAQDYYRHLARTRELRSELAIVSPQVISM